MSYEELRRKIAGPKPRDPTPEEWRELVKKWEAEEAAAKAEPEAAPDSGSLEEILEEAAGKSAREVAEILVRRGLAKWGPSQPGRGMTIVGTSVPPNR